MSGFRATLHNLTQLAVLLLLIANLCAWLVGWFPAVEAVVHFRPQYLWLATVTCLLALLLRRWFWAILAALLLLVNAAYVLPWYMPAGELPATAQLRLILANVHTGNPRQQAFLDWLAVEAPDIVVVEETDAAWFDKLSTLDAQYPFWDGEARDDNFGIMLFSRLPLLDLEFQDWGHEWRYPPSLEARVTVCDGEIALLATHPPPPVGEYLRELRAEQLQLLGEHVATWQTPGLIVGDLNLTPWSPLYSRLLASTSYADARRGFGILPSWTTVLPMPLRLPLDHVLHHPSLRIKDIRLGPDIGSDHLPVVVDIHVPWCHEPVRQ